MDPGLKGKLIIGKRMKDTHFGFTTEICTQILVKDLPTRRERDANTKSLLELNMKTTDVIEAIFAAYQESRGLLNPR